MAEHAFRELAKPGTAQRVTEKSGARGGGTVVLGYYSAAKRSAVQFSRGELKRCCVNGRGS